MEKNDDFSEKLHKEFVRPLANFPPSIWDHNFFLSLQNSIPQSYFQQIEVMKEKVKTMLLDSTNNLVQKVILIDQLCRLGVSYHFESDIEDQLKYIWDHQYDILNGIDYDLYTTALLFRTFRQHGFRLSSDIFSKFKGNDGKLKKELASDVKGMLQLYEATYLRTHNEDFLDEVRDFTISSLEFLITIQSSPHVVRHIKNSLEWPIHLGQTRLQARQYIDFYEKDQEIQNKMLLKFAKMDFNVVQVMLQNELIQLIRWWTDTRLAIDIFYARDRIVEGYFWITGVFFEPQYSRSRTILTKAFMLATLVDDTYDAFGSIDELKLFTNAVRRLDSCCIDDLPKYMKILYRAILEYENQLEIELTNEGRSFCLFYEKEGLKENAEGYFVEAKWCNEDYVPTFDEYVVNGLKSSGFPRLIISAMLGMGDFAGIKEFEWLHTKPKILKAVQMISRLGDDLKTTEHEYERPHVATGIECFKRQYGSSEMEAINEISKILEDSWKDLNEECMRSDVVSRPVLMIFVNFARTLHFIYKYRDAYTFTECLRDDITSLLVHQIPIQDE